MGGMRRGVLAWGVGDAGEQGEGEGKDSEAGAKGAGQVREWRVWGVGSRSGAGQVGLVQRVHEAAAVE